MALADAPTARHHEGSRINGALRPAAIGLLTTALLVQLFGWTRGTDEAALIVALHQLTPAPTARPLVVEIDQGAIDTLGPPPWDDPTWDRIEAALLRQGLQRAVVVEPWPLLVERGGRGPALLAAARVRRDGAVFTPEQGRSQVLHLPAPAHPWWWVQTPEDPRAAQLCAWGAPCADPGTRTPLRWVEPTHLPLSSLLSAEQAWLHAPDSPVLLGLTAPGWYHPVTVGTAGGPRPWVDALAAATASAVDGTPLPRADRALQLAWLILLYLAALARPAAARTLPWLLAAPVATLLPAGVAATQGWAVLPLTTAVLAFTAPVFGQALDERARRDAVARRLVLLTVRAATRAGVPRERISSAEALPAWLEALSVHHLHGARFAWLACSPGSARLQLTCGPDVQPETFTASITDPSHPDLVEARRALHGARSTRLLADDSLAMHLVPLRQGSEVVGYWAVLMAQDTQEPSLPTLARLARWLETQLSLPGHAGALSLDGTPTASMDDEALHRLHLATERVRARDELLVQSLGVPVLLTDTAGRLVQHNDAMRQALAAAGLEGAATLADLLGRFTTEAEVERTVQTLFHAGRSAEVAWPGSAPATLYLRPLRQHEDAPPAGVCCWLESHPQQVRWWAARDTLRHATRRIEDRLSHLLVATDLLEARNDQPAVRPLLTTLRQEARAMELQTSTLRQLFERGWESEELPIDLGRLVEEELIALGPELQQRGLTVRTTVAYLGPLGHGEPFTVHHGVQALLRTLVALARPGATLHTDLEARDRTVRLRLHVEARLDEGLASVLQEGTPAYDTREELRGLATARQHLHDLEVHLEDGRIVASVRLPQVPER